MRNKNGIVQIGCILLLLLAACTFAGPAIQTPQSEIENPQATIESPPTATSVPFQAYLPALVRYGSATVVPAYPAPATPRLSLRFPRQRPTIKDVTTLWIDSSLPAAVAPADQPARRADRASRSSPDSAMLRLQVSAERPLTRWVYAVATPFPGLVDGVTSDVLRRAWRAARLPGLLPGGLCCWMTARAPC